MNFIQKVDLLSTLTDKSFLAKIETLASRMDRYLEYFSHYPIGDDVKRKNLKPYVDQLDREDRIMWVLNHIRFQDLLEIAASTDEELNKYGEHAQAFKDNREKVIKRLGKMLKTSFESDAGKKKLKELSDSQAKYRNGEVLRDITRYITDAKAKGYTSILEYRFNHSDSVEKVLVDLADLERKEIAERPDDTMIKPTDEIDFLKTGQYTWFQLAGAVCRKEGTSMRHCGNSANTKPGDVILSLRDVIEHKDKKYHKPHLTFILNKGALGEMKARANTTPTTSFIPHIIALLKDHRIKDVKGSDLRRGHRPEIDFNFKEDLTPEQQKAVKQANPRLKISQMARDAIRQGYEDEDDDADNPDDED